MENSNESINQYLNIASEIMCSNSIKKVFNNVLNNLFNIIYTENDFMHQHYNNINYSQLQIILKKYFYGNKPEQYINFFEIENISNKIKIFYSEEDLNYFTTVIKALYDTDSDLNEINNAKNNFNINHINLLLDSVIYNYNIYEINKEALNNVFVKEKIEDYISNIIPMIILSFKKILDELYTNRNELFLLLEPFIKLGISDGKTIQLFSEEKIINQVINLNIGFIPFNRIGFFMEYKNIN